MSCFAKGMLGGLFILIAAAVIIPMYGDYRSRAESGNWLLDIASTKTAVASNITRLNSLTNSGVGVKAPTGLHSSPTVTIRTDGVILVHGKKYGQLLVLIPELANNQISWKCIGGSAKDVPPQCRAH